MERTQDTGSYGTSRTVLVGSLIGLLLAAIGITVLIDREGGQKLLASIYDLLGNAAGAEALRNGQGDQFFAKLLLAAIALLVGVGGIWLLIGTTGSVGLGLLTAALFDRIRRESLAKVFVFLPLAISLVGATVIWKFVYAWQPASQPEYGLLNAIWTAFGFQPIPWATQFPINLPAEMVILIWLQTGFAMVVFSAAIKGVSAEIIEAARLDGASERQLFLKVIVPMIRGTIVTVTTTVAIVTLKIFDIVMSISGGRNHDDVVAVRMFAEMFQFFNDGRAAALATVLFIAVLPVMILNLRNFRRQEAM